MSLATRAAKEDSKSRFLAKVPAPRRRDTPLPAFRKMRVQASGNSFPAYQKRGEPDRRQMADMIIMYAVEALIIMPGTRESSEDLREGLEAFGATQAEISRKMMPGEAIRGL